MTVGEDGESVRQLSEQLSVMMLGMSSDLDRCFDDTCRVGMDF